MRLLAFCALVTIAFGCAKPAEVRTASSNSWFQVELLFEHDGVKVYRFYDQMQYHYYADARGKTVSLKTTGGKNKHQVDEDIPTVETPK